MTHLMARLTAAALLGLLASSAAAEEALRLTIPLPLRGAQSRTAEILRRSYEIAAEEINAAGGIKGRKVALDFADSRDRPSVARSIGNTPETSESTSRSWWASRSRKQARLRRSVQRT